MRAYITAGVVIALLMIGVFVVGVARERQHARSSDGSHTSATTTAEDFIAEGTIVKNNPGLIPDVWYVFHGKVGKTGQTTQLSFDDTSVCSGASASGPCVPSIFIKGRKVRVEGTLTGSSVKVRHLTFSELLKTGIYDLKTGERVSDN